MEPQGTRSMSEKNQAWIGGTSKGIVDVELLAPSEITARIQGVHKLLLHTICEIIETRIQES
jgi:hypothetical protein